MTELVAVDIGGTHARFALATIGADGTISLGEPVTLATADHAGFEQAWQAFADRAGQPLPAALAFALAATVGPEVIRFTNNPWTIRRSELPCERLTLVNDLAAAAHAVACLAPGDFTHLCGPEEPLPPSGTISVIGPGTGLGAAQLWRDGAGGYHVQATEGGHIAFAPLDPFEDALLARLRARYPRVSVERVVSGPAIVDLHAVLAERESHAHEPLDDRTVWQRGLSGEDSLAAAAVERFCLSLGSVAGDLALAQGAAGVVIAGGLGLRLKDTLLRSGFAERFTAKGRFSGLVATLPVKLVTHPQPGLLGAAATFAKEHLA